MRLPSSNIRRIFAYAVVFGLGMGIFIYGFVRTLEQTRSMSTPYAILAALALGVFVSLVLVVVLKLALRQAAYDLYTHAEAITETQLAPPTPIGGDELLYMRETFTSALAFVPRPDVLPRLAADLVTTAQFSDLLDLTMQHLRAHVPLHGLALLLFDAERDVLYPAATCGPIGLSSDVVLDSDASALGRALRERRSTTYSGLQVREILPLKLGPEALTLYSVPLYSRTQPFGSLCLLVPGADVRLSGEQRAFIDSIAALLVIASQASLHRQLSERQGDRLAAFEQLGTLLASSERIERGLEQVLRVAAGVTDSIHGSLLLLEPDESRIRYRITLKEGDVLPLSVTAGPILKHGLAGWALRERRPDIIDDTERDTRWLPIPGLETMRSALVVPLLYGERALGILTLADLAQRHYSRRTLALVTALSAYAVTILARMQRDEMLESEQVAMGRRFFSGHVSESVLTTLLADQHTLAQTLHVRTIRVPVIYVGLRNLERLEACAQPGSLIDSVITPYLDEISAIVQEQLGFTLPGDDSGLLALFGYPLAQSDAQIRALRSAQQILLALRRLRGRWRPQFGFELHGSIGLTIGDVTIGVARGQTHQSLTLIGSAVREARRLQQIARSDEILIGGAVDPETLGDPSLYLAPLAPLESDGVVRPIYRLSRRD